MGKKHASQYANFGSLRLSKSAAKVGVICASIVEGLMKRL